MFKFKRVLAIILCMTMVLGSTLPNFASTDLTNNEETTSESIKKDDKLEKETEERIEESETDETENKSDETTFSDEKSESESESDETKTSEEEPESDETEVSEEEIESDETKSSEEETESIETETSETETSETELDEEKTASASEIESEETDENDDDKKYDNINVATSSETLNLDDTIKKATESEIKPVYEDYEEHGLGFIPNDFEVPAVEEIPRKGLFKLFGAPAIPESYDPRNETLSTGIPKLPPVRDQGSFGTCWAFSTIGMFETYLRLHGYVDNETDSNLSEAALTYFTQYGLYEKEVTKAGSPNLDIPGLEGFDYTTIYDRNKLGKLGGNQARGLLTMSSYIGAVIEDENTNYESKMAYIKTNGLDGSYAFKKNGFLLKNGIFLNKKNIDMVKQAIMDNGSVGISYHAGRATADDDAGADASYVHTSGGEYYYYTDEKTSNANHAILIVGWDDNAPKENFYVGGSNYSASTKKAQNNGGWLCRNSWGGVGNGTDGYFWMSYEEPSLESTMYTVEAMGTDTYKYNYHYDTSASAMLRGHDVSDGVPMEYANIFKVSNDEDQVLEAISVALNSTNVEYDILIYTSDTSMATPTNKGTKKAKPDATLALTQSGTISAAGIYTIELNKKISLPKNSYFSVIFRVKSTSSGVVYIFCDESKNDGSYATVNEAAAKQSFHGYKYNSTSYYWDDVNAEDPEWKTNDVNVLKDGEGRNYRIKAFTNPAKPYTLSYGWYNESAAGKSANDITKITLAKGSSSIPSSFDASWDIPDSNGLVGYIKGTEVTICAPENGTIYAADNSDHLFSGRGSQDSSGDYALDYNKAFIKCKNIVNINYLDTSNVTNMNGMFQGFGARNIYQSDYATLLSSPEASIINVTGFDTSKVTSMNSMFELSAIKTIDVSNFDLSKVTSVKSMFARAGIIEEIDIHSLNTDEIRNASSMFRKCLSLKEIDMTDLTFVEASNFDYIFAESPKLRKILVSDTFFLSNTVSTTNMFSDCTSLIGGKGTRYVDKLVKDGKYAIVDGGPTSKNPGYLTGENQGPIMITFNFDMNGHGTQINPVEVEEGKKLQKPTNPTATGYTFAYWYEDDATKEFDFNEAIQITANLTRTLYAKWNPITYTINYNTVISGATIAKNSIPKTYGVNATLDNPTKTDYEFVAWYKDNAYKDLYNGTTDLSSTQGGSVTIYAKWKAKITFNVNGHGSLPAGTTSPTYVELNGKITLPTLSNDGVTGYTFDVNNSWYDNSDISTATLIGKAGANYTVTEPKTIYARWNENSYGIIYYENGGTYESGYTKPTTRLYSATTNLPTSSEIKKTGYDFDGWYETSDFIGSSISAIGPNVAVQKVVYAKWKEKTYTVTYNDGSASITPYAADNNAHWKSGYNSAPTSRKYTEALALPGDGNVVKKGYFFLGWYKDGDASEKIITSIPANTAEDYVLKAKWDAAHTVTFNYMGYGTNTTDIVRNGYKVGKPTNPTYQGKSFQGWFVDDHYSASYDFNANVTSSFTLYAKWEDVPTWTVEFNLTSGSVHPDASKISDIPSNQYIENGNKATAPSMPVANGYAFKGWYRDANFATPWNFDTAVYEHRTLYGKWDIITYTITYNKNRGDWESSYSAPASWTVADIKQLPSGDDIKREHYSFDGWFTKSDFSSDSKVTTLVGVNVNLILYAKWTPIGNYKTINFLPNGGSGTMESQHAFEGEDTILYSNAYSRSGYSFSKWTSDDGRTFTNGQNIGNVTTDLILTAEWVQNPTPSPSPSTRRSSSGGGGGIPASSLPTTLPNGQPLVQAVEPVTTVSLLGIVETVATDAATGIVSTTVGMNFSPSSVISSLTNTSWSADINGKYRLQATNAFGQIVDPKDSWVCIDTNVVNATGQTIVVSDFYFFNGNGEMVTGWLNDISGKTYFLETQANSEQGKMTRGWKSISGKYYYFNSDGTLLKGGVTPDGYTVDATGMWIA